MWSVPGTVGIIQQKYPLWWLKEGNLQQPHPASTLCFLSETAPISYVTFQENGGDLEDTTFLGQGLAEQSMEFV